MDANEVLTIISAVSIASAAICIGIGSIGSTYAEAGIAEEAMKAIAIQPDEAPTITKTLFISMAMIESSVIYCLVISLVVIFANPFWNTMLERLK